MNLAVNGVTIGDAGLAIEVSVRNWNLEFANTHTYTHIDTRCYYVTY